MSFTQVNPVAPFGTASRSAGNVPGVDPDKLRTMLSVSVASDPEAVWAFVGGFGDLAAWAPDVLSGRLEDGGRTRHVSYDDGGGASHRLVFFDDDARRCRYRALETSDPVSAFVAELRVDTLPNGRSLVTWSASFHADGIADAVAFALVGERSLRRLDAVRAAFARQDVGWDLTAD